MNHPAAPASARTDDPQAPRPARTSVLLVDDHPLVRLGFRALVAAQQTQPGQAPMTMLEAGTLAEALTCMEMNADRIAVVVLDLSLPDTSGVDGLIALREAHPGVTIVVLSGTASEAMAHHALALGAAAFYPKSGDLGPMLRFVHACIQGGPQAARKPSAPYMPTVATLSHDIPAQVPLGPQAADGPQLSSRQLQILQGLLDGKSNREISDVLCLSEGTVKNQVSMLLLSFGVRSRSQLISKLRR